MNIRSANITLGTAGHIDHGKTQLVKNLTGCDTDRLKDEKKRGMSIELGFAPWMVKGECIGIVDVPGHENFIKTMVAGAAGIDAVIFVIAADDGIMPQTREHLDILKLLGVEKGIIALTKIDLVSPEKVNSLTDEIRIFMKGSFLEFQPIIPLSNIEGTGYDKLIEQLEILIDSTESKPVDGIFRMPVERTFSVKGYGTVLTGIPVSGSASVQDEVVLLPRNVTGRIRNIQVYKNQSESVLAGQCTAINIPQLDHNGIERGDVLTLRGFFESARYFLCELSVLDSFPKKIKTGQKIKFHTGTSSQTAVMYLMESNFVEPGQKCLCQFKLDSPVVACTGDRFIIRQLSPSATIGGGIIVDPLAHRLKRTSNTVMTDAILRASVVKNDDTFAEYAIKTAPNKAADIKYLTKRIKVTESKLNEILSELIRADKILFLDGRLYVHRELYSLLKQKTLRILEKHHEEKPETQGLAVDDLREKLNLDKTVSNVIFQKFQNDNLIRQKDHFISLESHRQKFAEKDQGLAERIEQQFLDNLFEPPKHEQLNQVLSEDSEKIQRLLNAMLKMGILVRIENILFHAAAVEKAKQKTIEYLEENQRLESVKFKYILNTSRKFALPLLDYMDKMKITRREGNTRYLMSDQK